MPDNKNGIRATQQKFLFFCTTNNFRNFTRRATIEAICRHNPGSQVLLLFSYWKRSGACLDSDSIKINPYYYFLPAVLLRFSLFNRINHFLNRFLMNHRPEEFDWVCFTNPKQAGLLSFYKSIPKIAILSDPYHMMGYNKLEEEQLLLDASHIFATSKALAEVYIPRYFPRVAASANQVHYWPNCADLNIWNISSVSRNERNKRKGFVVGFAGNFMEVTDSELLESIVLQFPEFSFVLAGRVVYPEDSEGFKQVQRIFTYKNVVYKGYIPFKDLQEEVMGWDICIMIDRMTELSSYHHHNKFYQYLALGKPVVYQRNHNDYPEIPGVVFPARGIDEFAIRLKEAAAGLLEGYPVEEQALAVVRNHSNTDRAQQFLNCLEKRPIQAVAVSNI